MEFKAGAKRTRVCDSGRTALFELSSIVWIWQFYRRCQEYRVSTISFLNYLLFLSHVVHLLSTERDHDFQLINVDMYYVPLNVILNLITFKKIFLRHKNTILHKKSPNRHSPSPYSHSQSSRSHYTTTNSHPSPSPQKKQKKQITYTYPPPQPPTPGVFQPITIPFPSFLPSFSPPPPDHAFDPTPQHSHQTIPTNARRALPNPPPPGSQPCSAPTHNVLRDAKLLGAEECTQRVLGTEEIDPRTGLMYVPGRGVPLRVECGRVLEGGREGGWEVGADGSADCRVDGTWLRKGALVVGMRRSSAGGFAGFCFHGSCLS